MQALLDAVSLDLNQVRVIVRAMVRVAECDGAREQELTLIQDFYEACRAEADGLADYGDVIKTPFDAAETRAALTSPAHQRALLTSCWLVAYADGVVSDAEALVLAGLTDELGVSPEAAVDAREFVKDQLLRQLSTSANLEALQEVARSL